MNRIAGFLFLLVAASGLAQEPDICPPPVAQDWAVRRAAILKARRGDKDYLPKPFPKTVEEFKADIRYSFFKNFYPRAKSKEEARPEHRDLFHALWDNDFAVEIIPVINWWAATCEERRYWVRVYRKPPGAEGGPSPENFLASMAVHEYGEVGSVGKFPLEGGPASAGQEVSLADRLATWSQDLRQEETWVAERFGVGGRALGYVAVALPGHDCWVINPCVLLESEGVRYLYLKHWLAERERLYRIDPNPRVMKEEELREWGKGSTIPFDPMLAAQRLHEKTGRWPVPWGADSRGKMQFILLEDGMRPRAGERETRK